jgi:hypothetical protein
MDRSLEPNPLGCERSYLQSSRLITNTMYKNARWTAAAAVGMRLLPLLTTRAFAWVFYFDGHPFMDGNAHGLQRNT